MSHKQKGTWRHLRHTIKSRFANSFDQPAVILYLVVVVIGFGGLGAWLVLGSYVLAAGVSTWKAVVESFATYTMATLAGASTDLTLEEDNTRALLLTAFLALLVGIALTLISFATDNAVVATITSAIVFFIAVGTWLVANSSNSNLLDTPPDATTGGDPTSNLPGDLSGIKA